MSIYIPDRNEVVYVPTRDELHDLVDAEFFALHPEAPASLDPTGRVDAD